MKKALSGGLLGLFIGGAVILFFSWVEGIISFRLVPPSIGPIEFTPQAELMLFQCLLAGAVAGGATYLTGLWVPGAAAGIVVGYGLGFLYVGQNDQPWETISALAMLLPVMWVGVLSSLASAVVRTRDSLPAQKKPLT